MHCRTARKWMSLWLDNRLDARREQSLQEHLRQCADCQRTALQWQRIRQALKAYPHMTPSAHLEARIWQAVQQRQRAPVSTPHPVVRLLASAAAGLAIALCLLTAMWLNTPRRTDAERQVFVLGGREAVALSKDLLGAKGGDYQ